MIDTILNMNFTIRHVVLVGGTAFIVGLIFGMVLMACLVINDNE